MKIMRILVLSAVVFATTALADVKPAKLFIDNMVIQRDTQASVWGWADAGEKVTVTGSWGEKATCTTDKDGKWIVKLQTPAAGGPHTITVKGKNTIEIKNVLSGDVWLCSGQSNMDMSVRGVGNAAEEIESANYPNIRHFKVARNASKVPASDCTGGWKICSPDTVSGFSATAYFAGRKLHKDLGVPIGLINSSWGGTAIESWTDTESLKDDATAQNAIMNQDRHAASYNAAQAEEKYQQAMSVWTKKAEEAKAQKKKAPRKPSKKADPHKNGNYPGNLYRGMINPLIPYAIKGAAWYQGERNGGRIESAEYYRVQLDRMIRGWRKAWGTDMPFYAVQLPNYQTAQVQPVETGDSWPVIRESFLYVAQNTPDVGMAVGIDVGEAKNVHPKNKQAIGLRLASTILNKTYGKQTPTSPFYKSHSVEGDKVVILFDYTGTGLSAKGGELRTFAIAGADKKFVQADAKIEKRDGSDVVVVSSAEVSAPASVRYAWANNPEECNLYSKEDFPASPFRTDDWPLSE